MTAVTRPNDEEEPVMSKPTTLVAFGAGYLFGARAGRDRYRQIRQRTDELWQSDAVRQRRSDAQQFAHAQVDRVKEIVEGRPRRGGDSPQEETGADDSGLGSPSRGVDDAQPGHSQAPAAPVEHADAGSRVGSSPSGPRAGSGRTDGAR
jgi:hypothetical protein